MAKRAAARRGQALVETALGAMVFVTILVFGIYFAEVGALTLKVQEAANFALWEATAHVHHDPRQGEFQRRGAVSQAEAEANRRYRDFDGRSSEGGGAMTVQLAIARARSPQVVCEPTLPGGDPLIAGIRPLDANGGSTALAQAMNIQSPGMSCTASSALRGARIGRFLEPGFFKVSQRRASALFTVCAAGRASDGTCGGRFSLLLDDWGLAGVDEGRSCALNIDNSKNCQNLDYHDWVQRVYRRNGGGGRAGSALASATRAGAGINEDQFFMSFRGEEDDYEQDIGASHAGNQTRWEVTPFRVPNGGLNYTVDRDNRWLGGVPH
ncbi:hypothetical protein [Cystobacter fuscus]|uniref:hypothetical protein n=1 Tax=Cystobacter fuscus TaxID=43 RepID=UPI002B2AD1C4|nr:hypothetical protein F0U63_00560 [Cystobacter fuscus]